jgi:iron complex transport system permease protein
VTMSVAVAAAPRARAARSRSWTRAGGLVLALGALAVAAACSLAYGSKAIPLTTVVDAFAEFDPTNNDHLIIRELRVPRTVIGLLVGAALGLAGAVMQGVTRNPLADPALLGVEAGASLAVVAGIAAFNIATLSGYVWFALVGAAIASVIVYGLSSLGRRAATPLKLALAGTAVAALLSSLTWTILLLDVTALNQFRFWMVGAIASRDASIAWDVAPFLAVGAVLAVGVGSGLNTLALGDDVARGLGQRVVVVRAVAALAVVLLCGAATAAAGPIAFVGLTVPHVARAICGPDYRWILPWSMVLAPTLLLGADVVGRLVARPGEIEVGIVTAVIGAPFFIALVRRRRLAVL